MVSMKGDQPTKLFANSLFDFSPQVLKVIQAYDVYFIML